MWLEKTCSLIRPVVEVVSAEANKEEKARLAQRERLRRTCSPISPGIETPAVKVPVF